MNKLKSKTLWIAIFALIFFILKNWGLLECIGLTSDSYHQFIDLILGVLITAGIVVDNGK